MYEACILLSLLIIDHLSSNSTPMEKKELLEKLHQKMIQEIQDYAIILLDIDGTILSWNMGAKKIKGYEESEILGQNFRIFYMSQDREAGLPEQLLTQATKEGRARHIGRRVKKGGIVFWGSILITALHDDYGSVIPIGFTFNSFNFLSLIKTFISTNY